MSVAVQEKDASLTKKKCRELLAELFGEARVDEYKEHVNSEVMNAVPSLLLGAIKEGVGA